MSGATDRREDEQVLEFYGRLDENLLSGKLMGGSSRLSSSWKTVTDWDQGCIGEVCMDSRRPL